MPIIEVFAAVFLIAAAERLLFKYFWKRGLTISVGFSKDRAVEGETLNLTETLTNRKPLPLPWVAVKFQVSKYLRFVDATNSRVSDDYYRNDLFGVMMFQRITRTLPFVCAKRGYYTIKSVDLVSNDVLYMSKLYSLEHSSASLTVYPRLIDADDFKVPDKKISGVIVARRFINPDPFEFKGIREYQSYDDFKTINFKATAKTGRLMVNMFDCTVSQEVVILLNLQKYSSWVSEQLYERSIRLAASVAERCVSGGIPAALVSNGRDVVTDRCVDIKSGQSAGHLETIYDALARVDLGREAEPIINFTRAFDAKRNGSQVFILISTYNAKDVADEFERLKSAGSDALWIIPVEYNTVVTDAVDKSDPKITVWEASRDE